MISGLRGWFSFPLLAKELRETAARRRTYILRVVYATLLYLIVGVSSQGRAYLANPQAVLGQGRALLEMFTVLQLGGIYLFMPALMAGAITSEKERGSLALLLLTRMTPGQIIAQKYLSGLIVMTSFLLLGLPMLGICYAFGGVEPGALADASLLLFLAMGQCGAIALFCSAWFRTTAAAFLSTFIFVGLLSAAPFAVRLVFEATVPFSSRPPALESTLQYMSALFPPALLFRFWLPWSAGFPLGVQGGNPALLLSLPGFLCTFLFLILARVYFIRRAFIAPRHRVLAFFRRLDATFVRANRVTGNIVLFAKDRSLPGTRPIAWREMTRKRIGRPNYLVRLLLVIEVPTLVTIMLSMFDIHDNILPTLAAIAGGLAVLAICVNGANTFVSERIDQTLDVLLTTPLSAAEIVREKANVMSRFAWIVAMPVATVFACRVLAQGFFFNDSEERLLYAVCAALSLIVYLPLFSWLAIATGMVVRSRYRAIIATLFILVAWILLPLWSASELDNLGFRDTITDIVACASPLMVPVLNETRRLEDLNGAHPAIAMIANFAVYGVVASGLRRGCFRHADALLRR